MNPLRDTIKLPYAFGFKKPNDSSYSNKKNVATKILGYFPIVGTIIGSGRIVVAIKSDGDAGFKARHICRGLIEMTSLFGLALLVSDIVVTVFRAIFGSSQNINELNDTEKKHKATQEINAFLYEIKNKTNNPETNYNESIEALDRILEELIEMEEPADNQEYKTKYNHCIENAKKNISNIKTKIREQINQSIYTKTNPKVEKLKSIKIPDLTKYTI